MKVWVFDVIALALRLTRYKHHEPSVSRVVGTESPSR